MSNLSWIQIVIILGAIVVASIVVLIALGILPGLRTSENEAREATLLFWGFDNDSVMNEIINKFREQHENIGIIYIQKNEENFEGEFLNSLAKESGPDVVIFPSYFIKKHIDKLSAAPPIYVTEREIRQQYIDAAEIFITSKNEVFGMPLYTDTLILYWNKDLFTKNLITLPPKTWDSFLEFSQKITRKDEVGNITVSGSALGRSPNIKHAPLVLSAMLLQSGEKIINETGRVVLGDPVSVGNTSIFPAESVLRFISDFSNPNKTSQSWSVALPEAKEMFISGRLGMYLGLTKEYNEIKSKNPHLSLAASPIPQLQGATKNITSGTLYGLAVPRTPKNSREAWQFITFLASKENSVLYNSKINNTSPRRDAIPDYQKDSVKSAFAESALYLKLWLIPDPVKTNQIFQETVEDVALGRSTLREILNKAKAKLQEI